MFGCLLQFQRLFDGFKENSVKFLYILLLDNFLASPLKTLHEIPRIDFSRVLRLELCEKLLKLIEDAVLLLPIDVLFVLPAVDSVAKLSRHKQRL